MGRLYQKTVSGEKAFAYFENGQVWSDENKTEVIINYNNSGQIYRRSPGNGDYGIASCDSGGNIRKSNGIQNYVIAKCEDGVIFEGNTVAGRILAYFDGDMYGAAAAVVATVLGRNIT